MRVFGQIEDAYKEKPLPGALVTLRVGDTELIEHTPPKTASSPMKSPMKPFPSMKRFSPV
jgi:hypothetical protein